jgi:hypothetical protein
VNWQSQYNTAIVPTVSSHIRLTWQAPDGLEQMISRPAAAGRLFFVRSLLHCDDDDDDEEEEKDGDFAVRKAQARPLVHQRNLGTQQQRNGFLRRNDHFTQWV